MKACKGPGKSAFLAWVGLWFLSTRKHPKIVATSITGDNLSDNLWAELSKWMKRSPLLVHQFEWTATRIFHKEHPETWWISARTWPKTADPSQQAETLAGVHADAVMFLIDEAGGIPPAVVATAEAGLANASKEEGREAFLVMAGNPTELDGALYQACVRNRAFWHVIAISSAPDDPNRTPRVSVEWAREQIAMYGWDSPFVLVNIRGEFPPGSSTALISVADAEAALGRQLTPQEYAEDPKVLGVDVARFGDDTTEILLRQGRAVKKPRTLRNLDTVQVAGQVAQIIEKHEPDAVFVDETGLGGGVVDNLRALGFQVIGVQFGAAANEDRVYQNRRCEMWWRMGQWLRGGGALPASVGEFVSELTGPMYWFDEKGRVCLESKKDMKKRGLPSPNKADALALTFAGNVARKGVREALGLPSSPMRAEYNPFA